MLRQLHIRNFAIIPTLELEFSDGFTVITGETGAGKSIMVDALSLLLGDRADSQWVRAGEEKAELNVDFDLQHNPVAAHWLKDNELQQDDECLIRRVISAKGRSRAFINGTPATLQQLQSLGGLLVEIHGQNEHLRLTRSSEQLKLLDQYGNHQAALKKTAGCYQYWQELEQQLQELDQLQDAMPGDLEYLKYQLQELDQHSIPADQVKALEQEHKQLAQGGQLLDSLNRARESLDEEHGGILSQLHQSIQSLTTYQALNPDLEETLKVLEEASINCQEASSSIAQILDGLDLSPERLKQVEDQLSQLHDLARKHRVKVEELDEQRLKLHQQLETLSQADENRARLEASSHKALEDYRKAAATLSKQRISASSKLATAVSTLMDQLGMQGGSLGVECVHTPDALPNPLGNDQVSLMVTTNPGLPAGPLGKIASGGELSRISLAIKVATSDSEIVSTQIFDEVDSGVGGDIAHVVGEFLGNLSDQCQVLCVTHLAQVAANATQQIQVNKQVDKNSTHIQVNQLNNNQRVDEIARMLSGKPSEQSKAHARELLGETA